MHVHANLINLCNLAELNFNKMNNFRFWLNNARPEIIDRVIEMKTNKFARRCWVTDFIYPDGSRGLCVGDGTPTCDKCGFCIAGEMASVFAFKPDTIFAGLKLRG